MRNIFLIITIIGLFSFSMLAQEGEKKEKEESEATSSSENNSDHGWNKRISFFIGAGASVMTGDVYESPIIDRTNNNVIIEKASNLKPNMSTGIIYTPWVYNVKRLIQTNIDGKDTIIYKYDYQPRKLSFALFINPLSLSGANSNLSSTVDLGIGVGWREDNFAFFLTAEFFSLQQPRDYFIDAFKSNDEQYLVGGEAQTAIDLNDNSIFKDKVMIAFGFKLVYTFDIVSNYKREAEGL